MQLEARTHIARPRQEIWAVLAQPSRYLDFMAGLTHWHAESPREGLGARYNVRMQVGSAQTLIELVEFDAPSDLAWNTVRGFRHRGRWRLRERHAGVTEVLLSVEYHAPGDLAGMLADVAGAPATQANLHRSLCALRRLFDDRKPNRRSGSSASKAPRR